MSTRKNSRSGPRTTSAFWPSSPAATAQSLLWFTSAPGNTKTPTKLEAFSIHARRLTGVHTLCGLQLKQLLRFLAQDRDSGCRRPGPQQFIAKFRAIMAAQVGDRAGQVGIEGEEAHAADFSQSSRAGSRKRHPPLRPPDHPEPDTYQAPFRLQPVVN